VNDRMFADAYPRPATWRPGATRVNSRFLGLALGTLLLLTFAALLYLSQASAVAELRYGLLESERQESELREEIAFLRYQIATCDSSTALKEHAQRLGLVDAPTDSAYLVCYAPTPRAMPGQMAAPAEAAPAVAARSVLVERLTALFAPKPKLQAMRMSSLQP